MGPKLFCDHLGVGTMTPPAFQLNKQGLSALRSAGFQLEGKSLERPWLLCAYGAVMVSDRASLESGLVSLSTSQLRSRASLDGEQLREV